MFFHFKALSTISSLSPNAHSKMIPPPHLYVLVLWLVCLCFPSEAQPLRGKTTRQLGTLTPFTTELVLALYYVDDNLEEQFVEATRKTVGGNSSTSSSAAVQHFCKSVNKQVRAACLNREFPSNLNSQHFIKRPRVIK